MESCESWCIQFSRSLLCVYPFPTVNIHFVVYFLVHSTACVRQYGTSGYLAAHQRSSRFVSVCVCVCVCMSVWACLLNVLCLSAASPLLLTCTCNRPTRIHKPWIHGHNSSQIKFYFSYFGFPFSQSMTISVCVLENLQYILMCVFGLYSRWVQLLFTHRLNAHTHSRSTPSHAYNIMYTISRVLSSKYRCFFSSNNFTNSKARAN